MRGRWKKEEEEEQEERGDQKQQEVSMETGPGERRRRRRRGRRGWGVKRMDAGGNGRIVPIWTLGDPHRPSRHSRAATSSSSFMVVFGPRGSDS